MAMQKKEWTAPQVCETPVGLEVTSYESAEIDPGELI
jgi:coenzyme PQQ precursor peptide PqqA